MEVIDFLCPLPTWMMLSMGVVILYAYYMSSTHKTFKKLGIPGPKPLPVIGNSLFTFKHGIFDTVVHGYLYYKSKGMYGTFEGRSPILTITSLDMLKEIMIKQFNNFTDRRQYASMDQKGMDSILFNVLGQEWKEYRALIRPSLSPNRLKSMYPRLKGPCNQMLSVFKRKIAKDPEIEISEIIGCLCMDLIGDFGFDVKCNSLENPEHDFLVKSRHILDVFGERTFLFSFFAPPFLKRVLDFFGIMILPKKDITYLRNVAIKAMAERRKRPKNENPQDLLQYMLDLSAESGGGKRKLTEEEIIGAALTYILAGYDTSAKGFFYCMYQLAMNAECFKKAQKEVDDVLQGEFPTLENVQNLKYLDQCINEGNRLIPLGTFVERRCVRDTTVLGQRIPAGMNIRIPIAGLHRDPVIYPDPDRYDPNRFSPEAVATRHQMAFLPFGAGPRACFGQPMAMMIMRIGMASLLQTFNMEPCSKSEYPVRMVPLGDVLAEHGLWLKITQRQPNTSSH